eukprot:SAG31_NODE_465_length_15313_cov_10.762390_6_plen_111_part_00
MITFCTAVITVHVPVELPAVNINFKNCSFAPSDSCGGHGSDVMFSIELQPGQTLDIGIDSDGYDSRHETSWGAWRRVCTHHMDLGQYTSTGRDSSRIRAVYTVHFYIVWC